MVHHFGSVHLGSLEMMDGAPCAGTWAPWPFASWLRKGMAGWHRTHHRGWRRFAPAHLFIPGGSCFFFFNKKNPPNINTLMHTQTFWSKSLCTILVCWVLPPPDLLNLASVSGTCYWKSWPEFYSFDLGGEKDCKGYQHGRGRQAHIVCLARYYP